jgi:uncharacterized YigZ family protein
MADHIRILTHASEGIYKEKGSKFLSFAMPVESELEVKQALETFKKLYYDARHICYAYVLGEGRTQFRAYDDGEPSGTGGRPILGQIHSLGLTNVLIVVVRYFGGILLGTGGLMHAYKQAAGDALANNTWIEKEVTNSLHLTFAYEQLNQAMYILKAMHIIIHEQQLDSTCHLTITVSRTILPQLIARLKIIPNMLVEKG